jgi:hypothetical protein
MKKRKQTIHAELGSKIFAAARCQCVVVGLRHNGI